MRANPPSPVPGPRLLRVGHSPDPDDAFMFYGLLTGAVPLEGHRFQEVVEPIERLNARALRGELEVTALSAHAYAFCADRYWILSSGASVGRGYGPLLVAAKPLDPESLAGRTVALPGELTTAALLARLILPGARFIQRDFDRVPAAVLEGEADAGVIIHEGQLTYASLGLVKLLDFGEWWADRTGGLPLPLGLDAVRADLGRETAAAIGRALRASIEHAFAHAPAALEYARGFGRGISPEVNDRFVRMYVNQDTRELPADGVRALEEMNLRAVAAGVIPRAPAVTII